MKYRYIPIILFVFISCVACEKDGKLQPHLTDLGIPEIISFEPRSGKPGTSVHIKGNNFSDHPVKITVYVGNWKAAVSYHSMHDLYFVVPDPVITTSGSIYVEIGGKIGISASDFTIITPWAVKARFPGDRNYSTRTFVLNGKGYIIDTYISQQGIRKNALWVYDPALDVWSTKADMPGDARRYATDFTIDNKAYVGLGYGDNDNTGGYLKDFWIYDPDADSWNKIADYPGELKKNALGFQVGGKGYVAEGYNDTNYSSELWEYDPVLNSWTQKNILPFRVSNAIELSGKTYIADYYGNIYSYFPSLDSLYKITSNRAIRTFQWFALQESLYFFSPDPNYNGAWSYNCSNDTWSDLTGPFPFKGFMSRLNFSTDTIGFCIVLDDNGKMYGFTPGNLR